MITVENALELISEYARVIKDSEQITTETALGRILSETIKAPLSLPPFRQSIMDGYALCLHEALSYKLIGEVKTGDTRAYELKPGEAVRIFTGARVPDTANAVVMQEKVEVKGDGIMLEDMPKSHQFIRQLGEQIKKGESSLSRGESLNPPAIGILRSLGIENLKVYRQPKISIIVTGNELVEAGQPLEPGQIYESNGQVIAAALKSKAVKLLSIEKVKDALEDTKNVIEFALKQSDLILISGGISVGDYDFVGTALEQLGVEQIFYKVMQKPGKPLYFGKKESTYVFALPGNPASTLTCLYIYAFALLDMMMGKPYAGLNRIQMPISETLENPSGRALFLKAKLQGGEVVVLNQQNSAAILSFARADALIYLPKDRSVVKKGSPVTTILLPSNC